MNSVESGRLVPKSFLKMFVVLVISFITYVSPVCSQTQYCYPDCDSSIWIPNPPNPPSTYRITLPCGDSVIVNYRKRHACNMYWDLFIEKVVFVNGSNGGIHCGETMTLKEMLDNVIAQMLVQDPMGFPPSTSGQDTCVENYRVILGACWKASFSISADGVAKSDGKIIEPDAATIGLLQPCLSAQCCLQAYTVCIVNHQKIITFMSGCSIPGECDVNNPPNCQPICE
jgi:hypothetical protein